MAQIEYRIDKVKASLAKEVVDEKRDIQLGDRVDKAFDQELQDTSAQLTAVTSALNNAIAKNQTFLLPALAEEQRTLLAHAQRIEELKANFIRQQLVLRQKAAGANQTQWAAKQQQFLAQEQERKDSRAKIAALNDLVIHYDANVKQGKPVLPINTVVSESQQSNSNLAASLYQRDVTPNPVQRFVNTATFFQFQLKGIQEELATQKELGPPGNPIMLVSPTRSDYLNQLEIKIQSSVDMYKQLTTEETLDADAKNMVKNSLKLQLEAALVILNSDDLQRFTDQKNFGTLPESPSSSTTSLASNEPLSIQIAKLISQLRTSCNKYDVAIAVFARIDQAMELRRWCSQLQMWAVATGVDSSLITKCKWDIMDAVMLRDDAYKSAKAWQETRNAQLLMLDKLLINYLTAVQSHLQSKLPQTIEALKQASMLIDTENANACDANDILQALVQYWQTLCTLALNTLAWIHVAEEFEIDMSTLLDFVKNLAVAMGRLSSISLCNKDKGQLTTIAEVTQTLKNYEQQVGTFRVTNLAQDYIASIQAQLTKIRDKAVRDRDALALRCQALSDSDANKALCRVLLEQMRYAAERADQMLVDVPNWVQTQDVAEKMFQLKQEMAKTTPSVPDILETPGVSTPSPPIVVIEPPTAPPVSPIVEVEASTAPPAPPIVEVGSSTAPPAPPLVVIEPLPAPPIVEAKAPPAPPMVESLTPTAPPIITIPATVTEGTTTSAATEGTTTSIEAPPFEPPPLEAPPFEAPPFEPPPLEEVAPPPSKVIIAKPTSQKAAPKAQVKSFDDLLKEIRAAPAKRAAAAEEAKKKALAAATEM